MRRLAVIMLPALAALGGVAFAMREIRKAGKPPRFTLSVTPARQGAVSGREVAFNVDVARAGSFTGSTALRVTGLPRGVRARWRLADGTRSRVVPPAETGAILTLRASRLTPLGRKRVKVVATGGGTRRARKVTLTVERPRSLGFSLRVHPARRIVAQGATVTYGIRVARAAGFRRRVGLRLLRLPRGARARRRRTALTVATSPGQRLGSHRLVVRGTSRVGRRVVHRYAVVVLTVVEARQSPISGQFPISGDLTTPLYPGGGAPLDLVLTNPHPFDIRVTALNVRVREDTTNPGCSGDANFAITQYGGGYPLVVRPGSTRLSALVANSAAWPQVSMHNLPTNQDACKNTSLFLDYEGLATR